MSKGAGKSFFEVVKFQTADHGPVPEMFVAFTLQKYFAFSDSPGMFFDVPVRFSCSKTSGDVNAASVLTCARYVDAPGAAIQMRSGGSDAFVELSCGDVSTGAAGTAGIVVKLQTPDHGLAPPALTALTRQKYVVFFVSPAADMEVVGATLSMSVDVNAAAVES